MLNRQAQIRCYLSETDLNTVDIFAGQDYTTKRDTTSITQPHFFSDAKI
jgi:hypothetical protein